MIGGEIKKIFSSSIEDSLSTWIGLLDGTQIRTVIVNLLYIGIIMDNHWNYVNFETLETHCNSEFLTLPDEAHLGILNFHL